MQATATFLSCLPFAVLSAPLLAQDVRQPGDSNNVPTISAPPPGAEPVTRDIEPSPHLLGILASSTVLQMLDGAPTAVGPDYRANFSVRGLQFTPQMPVDRDGKHLHFEFESISIGDIEFAGLDRNAEPFIDGDAVVFQRSQSVREVYEPRLEGLEQSFVFNELPSRVGDLVVRGRINTDFATPVDSGRVDAIDLGSASMGGIRLDKVLGVDARGRNVPGSMRIHGDTLELTLPAEFVRDAALPLVLDPLIGGMVDVIDTFYRATHPDMAYGALSDGTSYGVVFERIWAANDFDIYHIPLTASGVSNGPIDVLEGFELPNSARPSIGFVRQTSQYLAVWEERATLTSTGDIYCRRIDQFSISSKVAIANTASSEICPQVGSESTTFDNEVVVVWNTVGAIRAAQVTCNSGSAPFVFAPVDLETTGSANLESQPTISDSGGDLGHYVVAWQRFFDEDPADHDIQFRVIDRNLNILSSITSLQTIGPDETLPSVDGDGRIFLLAYQRGADLNDTVYDIEAVRLEFDELGNLVSETKITIDDDIERDRNPDVGFSGNRFYVAWEDTYNGGFGYDIRYVGLDAAASGICEPATYVELSGDTTVFPKFAPRVAGGGSPGRADLVFQRKETSASNEKVVFQALGTNGGDILNIGGGCGSAGTFTTNGEAMVGSPDFEVRLDGVDPGAFLAIYNYSVPTTPVACGSCLWTPFQFTIPAAVIGGSASLTTPIPCNPGLAGIDLHLQWTVLFTGDSPCPTSPNISFSDRLATTVTF